MVFHNNPSDDLGKLVCLAPILVWQPDPDSVRGACNQSAVTVNCGDDLVLCDCLLNDLGKLVCLAPVLVQLLSNLAQTLSEVPATKAL